MHGLVLSGGGAKGSWEAGAAEVLIRRCASTDYPVEMLAGTSVGGLNAVGIASMGPEAVSEMWEAMDRSQVFRGRGLTMLWRFLGHSGLYDTTPLRRLIERSIDLEAVRRSSLRVRVHATDLIDKRSVVFTNEDPDLLTGVLAGASVPGAFPPVAWRGRWLVDGGAIDNSPIRTLIQAGCDRITILYLDHEMPAEPMMARDVPTLAPAEPLPGLSELVGDSIESMMDSMFWRDLRSVRMVNHAVEAGHDDRHRFIHLRLLRPTGPLGGTLEFGNDLMRAQVAAGRRAAEAFGLWPTRAPTR